MNFIKKFMFGRYGVDQFTVGLLIFSILVTIIRNLINIFIDVSWLYILDWVPLFYALYRILSKNIQKRRIENEKFLKFWMPIQSKINFYLKKFKERKTHKYLKCPTCKTNLRVPKLNGKKISVKAFFASLATSQ